MEEVYGLICFGIILLLMWYVVRDALFPDMRCGYVDGMDSPTDGNIHAMSFMDVDADAMYDATLRPLPYQLTDTNYKYGPLAKGLYGGDIPSYLYTDFDDRRTPLWRIGEHGTYWPNSKTYWQNSETPKEAAQWVKREAGIYKPVFTPTYP